MAFKMKAGKEGPMKKNFPAAFKVDLNEVTVTAKAPKVAVLKPGFIYKDGEYFKEARDPSLSPEKVNMADAIKMKLKSQNTLLIPKSKTLDSIGVVQKFIFLPRRKY